MLVTRLSSIAPVLVGLPFDDLAAAVVPPDFASILERVRDALGDELRDVPGPVLLIPFDMLMVVCVRDVERDASDPDWARADISEFDVQLADNYGVFLEQVRASSFDRRVNLALNRLFDSRSASDVQQVFADFPELRSREARDIATAWEGEPSDVEERLVKGPRLELLDRASSGDFEGAWASYERVAHALWGQHILPRIEELTKELDHSMDTQDWLRAVEIGQELLELERATGNQVAEATTSLAVAAALYERSGAGQGERLEAAIRLWERTLEIYDHNEALNTRVARGQLLGNLGAAYAARLRGDPMANQERAISYHRQSLESLSLEEDGDAWAIAHTNLGLSLVHRADARRAESVDGDGPLDPEVIGDLESAIEHLEAALEWRSFDRNPRDWAFTEINLGLAFGRFRGNDRRRDAERAIEHYENARRGFEAAGDELLMAQVLHNLSTQELVLANLETASVEERSSLLESAVAHARASLVARPLDAAPVDAGRTFAQLGLLLSATGDVGGAIAAYREALRGLAPDNDPRECRDAATRLARLATDEGDWILAADAWDTAAESAAIATEWRVTRRGRFDELRESLNVFRWAAFASARVGRLERAIEILELGRAREVAILLRRETADLDRLRELDPWLFQIYRDLESRLEQMEREESRLGEATVEAARIAERLGETISAIRELPGLEGFLARATFADAGAAVQPTEALVYLLTSPWGSMSLVVRNTAQGTSAHRLDAPTLLSGDLARLFLDVNEEAGKLEGYIVAHGGGEGLDAALEGLSETIAPQLLEPLASYLNDYGVQHVCLVPIGLLGLLPLQALPWQSAAGEVCLLDGCAVSYAPSAFVRSACLQRSKRPAPGRRLLVVGNPLPHPAPLQGAALEAEMVGRIFPAESIEVLIGRDATKEAVLQALPRATHVHLACHAGAGILEEALSGGLSLAFAEELTAREILALDGFSPRLVVASACETGVIQGYETADEALALGTVFLAAGGAGALASLWAVDDYATALLMSRFYEVLAEKMDLDSTSANPAEALRRAQLWLRDLSIEDEDRYLSEHPDLRVHRAAWLERSADADGLSTTGTSRPYVLLSMWAPFTFSGA